MHGVVYTKKGPEQVVQLFDKFPPPYYIYIMLSNEKSWVDLLNGKEINAEDVNGINPEYLIKYGAILKNFEPIEFKDKEILQILIYYYRDKNIGDAIKRVKKKSNAHYIIAFNNRLGKFEDKYGI